MGEESPPCNYWVLFTSSSVYFYLLPFDICVPYAKSVHGYARDASFRPNLSNLYLHDCPRHLHSAFLTHIPVLNWSPSQNDNRKCRSVCLKRSSGWCQYRPIGSLLFWRLFFLQHLHRHDELLGMRPRWASSMHWFWYCRFKAEQARKCILLACWRTHKLHQTSDLLPIHIAIFLSGCTCCIALYQGGPVPTQYVGYELHIQKKTGSGVLV